MAERFSQMMPDRQSRQVNQNTHVTLPHLFHLVRGKRNGIGHNSEGHPIRDHFTPARNTTKWAPGQVRHGRCPTTSFLTATTLIYANGAGITAAAGTRLALHWILIKVFTLYSFQLPDPKKI